MVDEGWAHEFSLLRLEVHRETVRQIDEHARGRCLDAGTGHGPHSAGLRARVAELTTLDVDARAPGVDILGDLQAMPQVADQSFDTVVCTQVLEHVPHPWMAVAEIARVLKPGGYAIISVPHLSAIHEAPHDYFRFTEYGLTSLLEEAGFEVVQLVPCGGLWSFLFHYLSFLLLCSAEASPVALRIARTLNSWALVRALGIVDRALGAVKLFPCNYVVSARCTTSRAQGEG